MHKITIPAQHTTAIEAFIEDQTIMTCETGQTETGELTIINHHRGLDHQFWEFVEELLMFLPFGTDVKVCKFHG